MSDKELIVTLLDRLASLESLVKSHAAQIEALKAELAFYKSGRNSSNSHLAPSRDLHQPIALKKKRKKSSRNPVVNMALKPIA